METLRNMQTQTHKRKSVRFFVITGEERYKVVDLDTGGESHYDDKLEAYRMCHIIRNVLQHNYRLEVRS